MNTEKERRRAIRYLTDRYVYEGYVKPCRDRGMGYIRTADFLNKAGIKTVRGKMWTPYTVKALLVRVGEPTPPWVAKSRRLRMLRRYYSQRDHHA